MDMWKPKIVLFFVLLSFGSLLFYPQKETETKISKQDREAMSYFFHSAVFWDSYGYVLSGHKPCAISSYQKPTWNPLSWIECLTPHNLKMRKGWAAWRKHEKKFPHPNFVFIEENSRWTNAHFIILIHKDKFSEKVAAYQKDFFQLLGHADANKILHEATTKPLLNDLLKSHDGLIGSLLGFGRNNAWAFHHRSPGLKPFVNTKEQEHLRHFGVEKPDLSYMPLPGFMVDYKNPETEELKTIYTQDRKRIIELYQNKDSLQVTLDLLSY